MASIEIDGVISVLPSLGQDDLRFESSLFKTEKFAELQRVSYFL